MDSVLAEIRREADEDTAERIETVARLPNSSANQSRATCTSGSASTAWHGNGSSHATSVRKVVIQSRRMTIVMILKMMMMMMMLTMEMELTLWMRILQRQLST